MIKDSNDHVGVTPIVRDAWLKLWGREGTPNEILYSQAIASFETGYGRLGQFAKFAQNGQFNWGAEQRKPNADGACPVGYALGKDQGDVCFRVFTSDVDAAANFLRTLTKSPLRPDTVAAMAGTPDDVARAMRGKDLGKPVDQNRTSYYQGVAPTEEERIAAYANGIRTRAKIIGSALAFAPLSPPVPNQNQPPFLAESPNYLAYAALILAMAGTAWNAWKLTPKPKDGK